MSLMSTLAVRSLLPLQPVVTLCPSTQPPEQKQPEHRGHRYLHPREPQLLQSATASACLLPRFCGARAAGLLGELEAAGIPACSAGAGSCNTSSASSSSLDSYDSNAASIFPLLWRVRVCPLGSTRPHSWGHGNRAAQEGRRLANSLLAPFANGCVKRGQVGRALPRGQQDSPPSRLWHKRGSCHWCEYICQAAARAIRVEGVSNQLSASALASQRQRGP